MNIRKLVLLVALAPLACGGSVVRIADEPAGDGGADANGSAAPSEDGSAATKDAGVAACFDPKCAVSFQNDLWPAIFAATGKGACASSACHGATTPPMFKDAKTAYDAFLKEKTAGKPYVLPCARDVGDSAIYCNLGGGVACGVVMPLPPGTALAAADLQRVRTWVECGAPFD